MCTDMVLNSGCFLFQLFHVEQFRENNKIVEPKKICAIRGSTLNISAHQ